jgi:hypothetical protein
MSKPRPKQSDDAVIDEVASLLLPDVMKWLEVDSADEEEKEETVKSLRRAISWDYDGYAIAKNLDDRGWDPDARLVDILDRAGMAALKAHGNLCRKWVLEEGMEGPAVGTVVLFQKKEGVVARNDPDGKALVRVPAMGHVAEGRGCHGVFVPWEEITPC